MFETIQAAPPDSILGLTEAFNADPNPEKINLGVGVYRDANGVTPVLDVVHEAEKALLSNEKTKSYLPIDGPPAYATAVQRLLFSDHAIIRDERAATAQTPGGTGALRVVGDYLHQHHPGTTVWLTDPTWANHSAIYAAAGVKTDTFTYYDPKTHGLNLDGMLESLGRVSPGDVVLLHACCHNPTGVDPTPEQWRQVAQRLSSLGALPLLDFAYQGFAEGVEDDTVAVQAIAEAHDEFFVCSSFSKNFGLYRERVGALTVVGADAKTTAAVHSNLKISIRRNYSNPPAHGGQVVATVLGDNRLRLAWLAELSVMRDRINGMRSLFSQRLDEAGVKLAPEGNGFLAVQRGMFSYSGLASEQVAKLRDEHAIYMVGSGRINVAGITEANVDRLVSAIADVAG